MVIYRLLYYIALFWNCLIIKHNMTSTFVLFHQFQNNVYFLQKIKIIFIVAKEEKIDRHKET